MSARRITAASIPVAVSDEPAGAVFLEVCMDRRNLVRHYREGSEAYDDKQDSIHVGMKRLPEEVWVVWSSAEGAYPCE